MSRHNDRPVFLNLLQIRLPVTGVASFGHRLSGVLLFLLLPLALYLLELSLRDPHGFERAVTFAGSGPLQFVGALALWWFLHHLFAGIRFLLLDLDVGGGLPASRRSAWWVNLGAPLATIAIVVGVTL